MDQLSQDEVKNHIKVALLHAVDERIRTLLDAEAIETIIETTPKIVYTVSIVEINI
jgi:hypothetical protein